MCVRGRERERREEDGKGEKQERENPKETLAQKPF